jgi:hypothetical protein
MAIYLIQEPVSMFLLGVELLSLARLGRMYFKKRSLAKTLLSDRVDNLRLRDGLKIKSEIIQKKVERLILKLKEILSAKETADKTNKDRCSNIERRQFSYKGYIPERRC